MSDIIIYNFWSWKNKLRSLSLGKAHRLARVNYIPRILGLITCASVITMLHTEYNWANWQYIFIVSYFLVYPHLVYLASKIFPNNKKVEVIVLRLDAMIMGIWVPYMNFFFWMSYTFLSGVIINSVMVGGVRELLKELSLFFVGILAGGLVMGFTFNFEGPFYIEFLAMVFLLFYLAIAGWFFYDQTRHLARTRIELQKKKNILQTVEELEATRNELLQEAHKAGMADLATGVLHNVGNILNSINISTMIMKETFADPKLQKLKQANELLHEHIDHFEEFLRNDPRGKNLLQYYLKLEDSLEGEYEKLATQTERLSQKVDLIIEVIQAQQGYAKTEGIVEELRLDEVVKDTLKLQSGSIERHKLHVATEFEDTAAVAIQKTKVIHTLINLYKNAKEAMNDLDANKRKITVSTYQDDTSVYLSVADNGAGIAVDNLDKIFNHGFTTKEDGHGFGLHTCANYMAEMGGEIKAESTGLGEGTIFTLRFPK